MDSTDHKLSLDKIEDVVGGKSGFMVQYHHLYECSKCKDSCVKTGTTSPPDVYSFKHDNCPGGDGVYNYRSSEKETVPIE